MLFDPGTTHSYVSPYFASHFNQQPVLLDHLFWVGTPMGESLMVQLIFPSYSVSINGVDTIANLLLLEMMDFDDILGMDWLSSCRATVDCHSKAVKFEVADGPSFIFWGDSSLTPTSLIYFMTIMRLTNKGNEGYLAMVHDVEVAVLRLD